MEVRHQGKVRTSHTGKTGVRSLGVEKKLLGGFFFKCAFSSLKEK